MDTCSFLIYNHIFTNTGSYVYIILLFLAIILTCVLLETITTFFESINYCFISGFKPGKTVYLGYFMGDICQSVFSVLPQWYGVKCRVLPIFCALVRLTLTFLIGTRDITKIYHRLSFCIPLIRNKFHSDGFFEKNYCFMRHAPIRMLSQSLQS